jgi:hypothetical protein
MENAVPKLTAALIEAQRAFQPAIKESTNPHFRSKYVDLAGVWNACRDALHAHGLTVVQTVATLANGGSVLRSILLHTSGEQITSEYPLTPIKNDPQGMGSAMTYARRYSLAALVGIAPEDDDGEAGSGRTHHQQQSQPRNDRAPGSAPSTQMPAGKVDEQRHAAAPAPRTAAGTTPNASATTTSKASAATAEQSPPSGNALPEECNDLFAKLAPHGEKVARAVWKIAKDWPDRRDLLASMLSGVEHGIATLGKDECYKLCDHVLSQNGWPTDDPQRVRAIAHDFAAIKSGPPVHVEA